MTPPFRRPPARNDLPTDGEAAGARPSKTRLKHEMEALQELGETLVSLDAARLRSLELPERLVDAVVLARGITKHEARRRQMQYLGRLMRDVDPAPIRAALERWAAGAPSDHALFAAAEHWRDGKYLYLIHPSRDGQRERKYVGADPVKQAEAQASIRRAGEYDELSREAVKIEAKLRQTGDRLRDAVAFLTGKRAW